MNYSEFSFFLPLPPGVAFMAEGVAISFREGVRIGT